MKKTFKRAGVAVLSMAMLLSMGAMTVNAANTITVNNIPKYNSGSPTTTSDSTATVNIYQVAKRDSLGAWSWNTGYGAGVDITTLNTKTASEMNDLATTLAAQKSNNTMVGTGTSNATAITLTDATDADVDVPGYYLIVTQSSDTTIIVQPTLVEIDGTTNSAITIDPKVNTVPLNKTVSVPDSTQGANSADNESAVAVLGATLNYKIETQLPKYETGTNGEKVTGDMITDFTIADDPEDGISINNTDFGTSGSNVVVKINNTVVYTNGAATGAGTLNITTAGDAGAVGTYNVGVTGTGDGFTVTIPGEIVYGKGEQSVEVTFNATVDSDATTGADSNDNTATITYGNNFSTGGGSATKSDTVPVYTGEIKILKQGTNDSGTVTEAALDGAHFKLQKENSGSFVDVAGLTDITTTSGLFTFGYLSAGTYKLIETQAPHNYRTTGEVFDFTVTEKANASDAQFNQYTVSGTNTTHFVMTSEKKDPSGSVENVNKITVANPPAHQLPGTGGMGTVLFTVGGAAIVLLAGVLFVVYMRKRKVEE